MQLVVGDLAEEGLLRPARGIAESGVVHGKPDVSLRQRNHLFLGLERKDRGPEKSRDRKKARL
jgi:hypothetical protein